MKRRSFLLSSAALALTSVAFAVPAFAQGKPIVVGGKDFTEQLILASMTAQLLAAKGFTVDKKVDMGSSVVRQAMENGQVDVYWEYTGTSLISYNKVTEPMSPQATYDKVKELDGAKGMVWLNPSTANNTFVLVMTRANAEKHGIATMSDMAKAINSGTTLSFSCDPEFTQRVDGLRLLENTYKFKFGRPNIKVMSSGLVYDAVRDGNADIALAFATDGRIPAFDFTSLNDDLEMFAAYALVPVVLKTTLDANPTLADLLNDVSALIDTSTMAKLNAAVDVDKKTVDAVAEEFLKQNKLI